MIRMIVVMATLVAMVVAGGFLCGLVASMAGLLVLPVLVAVVVVEALIAYWLFVWAAE